MTKTIDFQVRRDNIAVTRTVSLTGQSEADLTDGEVLLHLDRFAFTANNITYAVAGDMMSYWNFFPAADGWGRIPVWGFGDVIASRHGSIEVGARYYGYFPMSTHLTIKPDRVTDQGFSDGCDHRKDLHAVYNQYTATTNDPIYTSASEDLQLLFRPLFTTAFLIDDFLDDNAYFGADQVIVSSASAKTAFGTARLLSARKSCQVIGLTSQANKDFVTGLGCYDKVVTYEDVETLDTGAAAAFVDIAGNGSVRARLHHHFKGNLKYSCTVGASHWNQGADTGDLPGAKPMLFFAPAQGQKRNQDWGPAVFQERFMAAWIDFTGFIADQISIDHDIGTAAIETLYQAMLAGNVAPDHAHIAGFDIES